MQVSIEAQSVIQRIMNELSTALREPNKKEEIEEIRKVCRKGEIVNVKPTRVDVWLENEDEIYMFDLKTAKPNINEFKGFKKTLLEWVAVYLYQYPDKIIHTGLAIPYNPYEPEPYQRWTMQGMFDRDEILVAEHWWDFLGGSNTYEELLDCFEAAGISLRSKIDAYFNKFNNSN